MLHLQFIIIYPCKKTERLVPGHVHSILHYTLIMNHPLVNSGKQNTVNRLISKPGRLISRA